LSGEVAARRREAKTVVRTICMCSGCCPEWRRGPTVSSVNESKGVVVAIGSEERDMEGPRYRRLVKIIRDQIEAGQFGDNIALPSERDLAVQHSVSRETVRKALRLLEEAGDIYIDHGRGAFPAPSSVRRMRRFLGSFSDDTRHRGDQPGQNILVLEAVPASFAIAGALNIDPGRLLTRLKRLRLVNGKPIGVHDAYIDIRGGASFSRKDIEEAGSLYTLLIDRFGMVPAEALESVTVCLASAEDAVLLNVAEHSPLLLMERVTISDRHVPIEYCVMKYVKEYTYKARITGKPSGKG
jgi:GntR family transcriptional regulator